jgi:galactokinase
LFAPYRICPLGAHVDHQHGLVTGFAFDSGIEFLFSATETGKVEMASLSFEGLMTFNVTRPIEEKQQNWGDYLRGAVWALQQDFQLKQGVRGIVQGSMPIGGLSSSAALLCGFVMAIDKVNSLGLSKMQVIEYASRAERNYVGLNNGILDQACVVLCEADKLLYLDTRTSEYQLLPFGDGKKPLPFKLGIFFSGVTRKLTGTDYNLRVSECKTAAWIMQAYENEHLKELQETRLRDVPEETFLKYEDKMPERFAKRARHFYTECDRVTDGVKAWQAGDIKKFGEYIFQSCESSMNNYECGSPELIALYKILRQTEGVYGGRFSGAGFKGACIALVDPTKEDSIRKKVTEEYLKQYPQYKESFELFFCDPANGVDFL